jgi:hypothetical protein
LPQTAEPWFHQAETTKETAIMATDEGVELESVRTPLSGAGEILTLWQDDDGSVGLTFASDVKPETWKAILSEVVFEIADELADGDDNRRNEIIAQIMPKA